jgi:hypothetical protein
MARNRTPPHPVWPVWLQRPAGMIWTHLGQGQGDEASATRNTQKGQGGPQARLCPPPATHSPHHSPKGPYLYIPPYVTAAKQSFMCGNTLHFLIHSLIANTGPTDTVTPTLTNKAYPHDDADINSHRHIYDKMHSDTLVVTCITQLHNTDTNTQ